MATSPIVIERGLKATFTRAMNQMQAAKEINPGLLALALQSPSDGFDEKYGWIGAMPGVKEWIGELQSKEFADYDYSIRNKDWEVSVPIYENDLADDRIAALQSIPQMLVRRLAVHPEKLIIDLLTGGTSGLAYDGVAFFSNASGARTIDNLLAGTGTSLAQMAADLTAARIAMAKFVDDQGEVLNIQADTIICPIELEDNFRRLVQSMADPTASGGLDTYNPYSGKFRVIGDARLSATDANDWYLAATGEVMKPFVYQLRQGAEPNMEKIPLTKQWVFSANYRGNAGYGLPHLCIKTVNS